MCEINVQAVWPSPEPGLPTIGPGRSSRPVTVGILAVNATGGLFVGHHGEADMVGVVRLGPGLRNGAVSPSRIVAGCVPAGRPRSSPGPAPAVAPRGPIAGAQEAR